MVLINAFREYLHKMLNDISGVKVLIVDKETLPMVSLVLSQSEILHKDVYLVENLDHKTIQNSSSSMRNSSTSSNQVLQHMKALCFLRPVSENMSLLKASLRSPKYGEYHMFFTNLVSNSQLHILADADEFEVVKQIQEFYGDYYALDPYHFTVDLGGSRDLSLNAYSYVSATVDLPNTQRVCERSVESLLAVFLSLKKRPVVRYQSNSEMAKRIAQETWRVMYDQEKPLFDFRRSESHYPLLLVMDRREDPLTPLLNQWTYQAMVHELLGMKYNCVDLKGVEGLLSDANDVVLSCEQDSFFRQNMFENFGEVSNHVSNLVKDLQKRDPKSRQVQSIEDMSLLLESFPEFRKHSSLVSKHVTLLSELQKKISSRKLMAVSLLEQQLACLPSLQANAAYEEVSSLCSNPAIADVDKIRLCLIFALRFESEQSLVENLISKLSGGGGERGGEENGAQGRKKGSSKLKPAIVYTFLRQFGSEKRKGDLFGSKDLLNIVARNVKRGLQGVENMYTQHHPYLSQLLDMVLKGKLRENDFPFVRNKEALPSPSQKPSDIVVFIVGGSTYEESRAVALLNSQLLQQQQQQQQQSQTSSQGASVGSGASSGGSHQSQQHQITRVLLGGTSILNSSTFMEDVAELHRLEMTTGLDF